MDITIKAVLCVIVVVAILNYVDFLVRKKNKDNYNKLLKYLNDIIHNVEVEKIDGVEYWFDADKSSFLAQGKNDDEVISVIKHRFPDHIFLIKDRGGIASNTDWQIVPFEELKTLILQRKGR